MVAVARSRGGCELGPARRGCSASRNRSQMRGRASASKVLIGVTSIWRLARAPREKMVSSRAAATFTS